MQNLLFRYSGTGRIATIHNMEPGSSNSQISTSADPAMRTSGNEHPIPHGPLRSSRWECPARYTTNHKHQDGRLLCRYCECWNPAPFPKGRLPIEPAILSTPPSFPAALLSNSQSSSIQLPPGPPSCPSAVSNIYSSYNLPPAPDSRPGRTSVCLLSYYILFCH